MDIALNLNIHRIIPLKLPLIQAMLIMVGQLNSALFSILRLALPKNILDDVIDRHINRCTLQPQRYHEPLGAYFLLFLVQVQVYKTLDDFLFKPLASSSGRVDLVHLVDQVLYLYFGWLLLVDALLQLLMHHVIGETS